LGRAVSAGQNLSAMAGNAVNSRDGRDRFERVDADPITQYPAADRTAQAGSVLQTGGNLGVTSGGDIGITGSTLKSGGDMLVAAQECDDPGGEGHTSTV